MANEKPIDIDGLLTDMETYNKALQDSLDSNEHPGKYIVKSWGGEQFIDWMLESNGTYVFKNTNDFVEYLGSKKKQLVGSDEPFSIKARVPINFNDRYHSLFYHARIKDGKLSIIGIDPAGEESAKLGFNDISEAKKIYPEVIDHTRIYTLNLQKVAIGCPSFLVSIAENISEEEFEVLHDEVDDNKVIVDSYANKIPLPAYIYVQSGAQLLGIITNPKHANSIQPLLENHTFVDMVSRINDPNYSSDTLLNLQYLSSQAPESIAINHLLSRVTQLSESLKTQEEGLFTFSNLVDRKRIKKIEEIKEQHYQLKSERPEQAGQIAAQRLSGIYISRPPEWDNELPRTHQLLPDWCPAEGLPQLKVSEDEKIEIKYCDELSVTHKLEIASELLDAMPKWTTSSLRIDGVSLVKGLALQCLTSPSLQQSQDERIAARTVLRKASKTFEAILPQMHQPKELEEFLELDGIALSTLDQDEQLEHARQLAGKELNNSLLKQTLLKSNDQVRILTVQTMMTQGNFQGIAELSALINEVPSAPEIAIESLDFTKEEVNARVDQALEKIAKSKGKAKQTLPLDESYIHRPAPSTKHPFHATKKALGRNPTPLSGTSMPLLAQNWLKENEHLEPSQYSYKEYKETGKSIPTHTPLVQLGKDSWLGQIHLETERAPKFTTLTRKHYGDRYPEIGKRMSSFISGSLSQVVTEGTKKKPLGRT